MQCVKASDTLPQLDKEKEINKKFVTQIEIYHCHRRNFTNQGQETLMMTTLRKDNFCNGHLDLKDKYHIVSNVHNFLQFLFLLQCFSLRAIWMKIELLCCSKLLTQQPFQTYYKKIHLYEGLTSC
jgi:hypothetical protein